MRLTEPSGCDTGLSLIQGDAAYRLQRRLHLIPACGMGVARRAALLAALTWIPMALGAWWARRQGLVPAEPLLAHYGIHVRCLLAIPLLILAEGAGHRILPRMLAQFEIAGLVHERDTQRFRDMLAGVANLRDRTLPWVLILGLVLVWSTTAILRGQFNDVDMRLARQAGQAISFSQWWFALVVRPVFIALLLAWLWRTLLVYLLLRRVARFPLCVIPAHPDRRGGLGFLERLALIFSPVAFAISAVAAATFGHDVMYHGVNVMDIKFELAGTAILVTILFLTPFIPLSRLLLRIKFEAMLDYGALVAQHGRLVYWRWILKEEVEDEPILDAPELGPLADVQTMYQAVEALHVRSVDKLGFFAIAVPAALPVAAVTLIQIPFSEIVGGVLKAVM